MTPLDDDLKSCDSQLLMKPPNPQWGVEDLGRYARAQDQAIVASDRSLTACYWRLGLALNLARKHLGHRQWGRFLDELGIDKTRASRARAIHGTFETEQQVAELSVQEAYGRREKKPRLAAPAERRPEKQKEDPIEFLLGVCKQADFFSDHANFTEPDQAAAILTMIDETIAELDKLRSLYRQRVRL